MKFRTLLFLVMLQASFSMTCMAATVTGKVTYTGTYGSGRLIVALDTTINEPGCPLPRFDVAPNHPQIKIWVAIATAASLSGKSVVVYTNGCYEGLPTMTQDTNSYFYIQN